MTRIHWNRGMLLAARAGESVRWAGSAPTAPGAAEVALAQVSDLAWAWVLPHGWAQLGVSKRVADRAAGGFRRVAVVLEAPASLGYALDVLGRLVDVEEVKLPRNTGEPESFIPPVNHGLFVVGGVLPAESLRATLGCRHAFRVASVSRLQQLCCVR